jgi:hypothetical protein
MNIFPWFSRLIFPEFIDEDVQDAETLVGQTAEVVELASVGGVQTEGRTADHDFIFGVMRGSMSHFFYHALSMTEIVEALAAEAEEAP